MRSLIISLIIFCSLSSAAAVRPIDAQLAKLVTRLCLKMEMGMGTIGYDGSKEPDVLAAVKNISDLIDQGADPNFYEPDSFKFIFDGYLYTDVSVFGALILIAGHVSQPDLVAKLIQHGANVRHSTRSGWKPIDFALMNFDTAQFSSSTRLKSAVTIVSFFEKHGVALAEGKQIERIVRRPINHLRDLAHQLLTLKTLADLGLVSHDEYEAAAIGKSENRVLARTWTTPDLEVLKKWKVSINDYGNELPAETFRYSPAVEESLMDVARRFQLTMGTVDLSQTEDILARKNNLPVGTDLAAGQVVEIPLRADVDVALRNPPAETWLDIAVKLKEDGVYYRRDASADEIFQELLVLNKVTTPADAALPPNSQVLVPYTKDRYEEFTKLSPPTSYDPNRRTSLFVIEGNRSKVEHDRHTYRVATHVAKAINPLARLGDIQSWNEILMIYPYSLAEISEGLRVMLNLAGSSLQDRVVFTHSMGIDSSSARAEVYRDRNDADNFDYNSIVTFHPYLEEAKPIIFHSSGNFNLSEGRFAPMYDIVHSPRTVMVGAAGRYQPGKSAVISPYSSQGADICAPIPKRRGRWMEGTSFSTPLAASIFRQFNEWYGNRLSFDEIMAAAMWSAETNIATFRDLHGSNSAALNGDPTKFAGLETVPAKFIRNGGGLPHSEHCGAGLINEVRWQEGLEWMLAHKQGPSRDISKFVVLERSDSSTDFVYTVTVPEDMTLGKLTFFTPQYRKKHSDITVITPSGFEYRLARSTTDVFSTYAFAYEDVKAGDKITIKTWRELAPGSGIQVRGVAVGNVVQAYRDFRKSKQTASF